jgi:hypothetical protein
MREYPIEKEEKCEQCKWLFDFHAPDHKTIQQISSN